ncbi:MAG: histidine ammonia-lyase [Candidatus Latescibacteria bacterium]|nr:histidine ammonia-lyase [Candidatus Latescibacterota bacterium]
MEPALGSGRVVLGGSPLPFDDLKRIADGARVSLAPDVPARVAPSRALIERLLKTGESVYGVNTGFGELKSVRIEARDVEALQANLIRSHAAGSGPPLEPRATRLMLALRAHSLALGFSGVRLTLLEHLVKMLEANVIPVVPSRGSLGASGDLIPLAHLALAAIGEGEVHVEGRVAKAADLLRGNGIAPLTLQAKEGLALINGTQAMTSVGALALIEAADVLRAAHVACALSADAARASIKPFDPRVHAIRPHEGQRDSAAALSRLLTGSGIVASHEGCGRVQDPYSIRCAPQVMGSSITAFRMARETLLTEVNSVSDNPICFAETGEVVSAGNFHGEPVAQALDFFAIGMAEIGSIAERRTFLLLDSAKSGLPAFLSPDPGLRSGLMIVQYLQAALVSENRMLAQPASVDSIPTSAGQEDHVSMGMHAALKALALTRNVRRIVAAELLCAAQGIHLLRPLRSSAPLEGALEALREIVPPLSEDRRQDRDLERVDDWIASGAPAAIAGVGTF